VGQEKKKEERKEKRGEKRDWLSRGNGKGNK